MRMQPWDEPDYYQHSADGNRRGEEFGVDSYDIDINRKFIYGDEPEPDPDQPTPIELVYKKGKIDLTVTEI